MERKVLLQLVSVWVLKESFISLKKKEFVLPADNTFDWELRAPEYAAVTLELDYSGVLEITLNGRTYILKHEEAGQPEIFGARLYKSNPHITLKALSPSHVYSLKMDLYDCNQL